MYLFVYQFIVNNRYDYVELYDGIKGSLGPWNKTATLCRRSQRGLVYFSSGAAAKIRFVTDGSWTRYGFKLKIQAGIHIIDTFHHYLDFER
jgi:hypothetical protein